MLQDVLDEHEKVKKEIRELFNNRIKEIKNSDDNDPDKIATLELIREYFTNPEFKKAVQDMCYEMNS